MKQGTENACAEKITYIVAPPATWGFSTKFRTLDAVGVSTRYFYSPDCASDEESQAS